LSIYIQKYPTPEDAAKHSSEALVSLRHFEDAIRKIILQRETKPKEAVASMAHFM
jgi:transitional endoplasmic reticulum ATPase